MNPDPRVPPVIVSRAHLDALEQLPRLRFWQGFNLGGLIVLAIFVAALA